METAARSSGDFLTSSGTDSRETRPSSWLAFTESVTRGWLAHGFKVLNSYSYTLSPTVSLSRYTVSHEFGPSSSREVLVPQ